MMPRRDWTLHVIWKAVGVWVCGCVGVLVCARDFCLTFTTKATAGPDNDV